MIRSSRRRLTCGKTALDFALARDWNSSLRQWPQEDIPVLKELRNAGGAHREEAAFARRARDMVAFLREMGGKTHGEIFGLPDFTAMPSSQNPGLGGTTEGGKAFEMRPRQPPTSGQPNTGRRQSRTTSERIWHIWGYAAGFPSLTLIQNMYPQLCERTDPNLPRLSTMYEISSELFTEVMNTGAHEDLPEKEAKLLSELHDQKLRLEGWASQNGDRPGVLDCIQGMPGNTPPSILAGSVFVCLFEIKQVLEYMLELSRGQKDCKMLE